MQKEVKVRSLLQKIAGVVLIILGFTLHLIPLFPAGWIIILGFELLGVNLLLWDNAKAWCRKFLRKSK